MNVLFKKNKNRWLTTQDSCLRMLSSPMCSRSFNLLLFIGCMCVLLCGLLIVFYVRFYSSQLLQRLKVEKLVVLVYFLPACRAFVGTCIFSIQHLPLLVSEVQVLAQRITLQSFCRSIRNLTSQIFLIIHLYSSVGITFIFILWHHSFLYIFKV